MARVDPDDESVERYVVQRYRFDPQRRERRNVTEVAFDDVEEFETYLREAAARLEAEKVAGTAESVESYSGHHRAPGHREAMRRRRLGLAPELTIVWVSRIDGASDRWTAARDRREVTGTEDEVVAWARQQRADLRLILGHHGWGVLQDGEPEQENQ
ncbi:MAG: hypothetical protein ACTHQ3_01350 [Motilibacteraceae bacterium]